MTLTETVRPQTHELDAHLIFTEYGLDPFYWLDSVRKDYDEWDTEGKPTATMEHNGDTYHLCYDYDISGLDPWDHQSYTLETVPQFRIYFTRDDELYNGERADKDEARNGAAGTMLFRPRWPNLTSDGEEVEVPDLGGPYLDCRIQQSNHKPHELPELLSGAVQAFGGNPRYFEQIHETSNVTDLAVYVRLLREVSGRVHAPDGPIARMHTLLEGDREGYRKHVEDHRELPGYYVTTTLTPDRVAELIRGHRLPVEIKHYYPNHPKKFEEGEALYYPKVEVSYQTSQTDETLYWEDVENARRELAETLMNVLEWADVSLTTGEPYVSDAYFDADEGERWNVRLVDDPTPEIESEQKARVMTLWGDMLDSDRQVIEHLLTDGGATSPADAADATGLSYRTIRRVIERLEGVVEHSYGDLQITSKRTQQELLERVRAAGENFKTGVEAAVMDAAEAGADRSRSAWKAAKHRYDVTVRDGEGITKRLSPGYVAESKEEARNIAREIKLAYQQTFGDSASVRGISAQIEMMNGHTTVFNLWNIHHVQTDDDPYMTRMHEAQQEDTTTLGDLIPE